MTALPYRMTLNHIMVRLNKAEKRTKGGVYLPDHEVHELSLGSFSGDLVLAGPSAFLPDKFGQGQFNGNGDAPPIIGEKVYFRRYSGENLTIERGGDAYRIMTDECLLGVYRDDVAPIGVLPLRDKCLVLVDPWEEKIGSLIVPDSVRSDRAREIFTGEIVACGAYAFSEEYEPRVRTGMRVVFKKHGGIWHEHEGKGYRFLVDVDVLGIET